MQFQNFFYTKQAESLLVVKTVNCFLNGLCSAVGYTQLPPPSKCTDADKKTFTSSSPHPVEVTYRTLSRAEQKRSSLFSMSSPFWSPGKMAHGGGVLPNMGPRAALHGAHHGSLVGAAVTHAFQLPLQHIYYPTTLPSTYDSAGQFRYYTWITEQMKQMQQTQQLTKQVNFQVKCDNTYRPRSPLQINKAGSVQVIMQ